MLVEHTFISIHEKTVCFQRASEALRKFGFVPISATDSEIKFGRGLKKPKYFSHLEKLPQSTVIHFDRGRITVAASLTPFRKPHSAHENFLLVLATAIENSINADENTSAQSLDETTAVLASCRTEFAKVIRKRWYGRIAGLVFLLVIIPATIIFLVVLNS